MEDNLVILKLQVSLIAGMVVLLDEDEVFNTSTNLNHSVYLSSGFCPPNLEKELYEDMGRNDSNTITRDLFNYIFTKRPAPSCWRSFYSTLATNNLTTLNQRSQDKYKRDRVPPRARQYYTGFREVQRPAPSDE